MFSRPLLCVILLGLASPAFAQVAPSPPPAATPAPRKPATPVVKTNRSRHAIKVGGTAIAKPIPAMPPAPAPAPVPPAAPPPVDAAPVAPKDPPVGTVTKLPLPRWASLRTDEVNLRAGPGTRYPIDWVYKRRDLPVRILREFEVWRLVEDEDGIKGWVHQATLVGRRDLVVSGADRTLRAEARADAAPVALLKVGVVGRIRSCDAASAWCEVQVGDYRGWLRRDEFWGTSPGEAVQ